MVTWTQLIEAIARNKEKGFHLGDINRADSDIDVFRLKEIPKVQPIVLNNDDEDAPIPLPPTKSIGVVMPMVAHPVAAPSTVSRPDPKSMQPPPPGPAAIKLPHVLKQTMDPIVVGIEHFEPLYEGAPFNTKHSAEILAATAIEAQMNELYKTEGGRSRGWTKSGLDLWIKPRCASGGNLKELDRAKAGFAWQLLMDDKAQSAFLDFVCLAKRIRIAVWFDETKTVLVYPAADVSTHVGEAFPLYNVSSTGHLMNGPRNGEELFKVCQEHKYTALPPLSVMASLNGLKLDELENVGKQLGMASVDGKKVERVAAIAAFKLRQRLCA